MAQKIKLDGNTYEISDLNDKAIATLKLLQFTTSRMNELQKMHALLKRSRQNHMDELKKEMLSIKGGFLLEDE